MTTGAEGIGSKILYVAAYLKSFHDARPSHVANTIGVCAYQRPLGQEHCTLNIMHPTDSKLCSKLCTLFVPSHNNPPIRLQNYCPLFLDVGLVLKGPIFKLFWDNWEAKRGHYRLNTG